jgi:hypothetical protein
MGGRSDQHQGVAHAGLGGLGAVVWSCITWTPGTQILTTLAPPLSLSSEVVEMRFFLILLPAEGFWPCLPSFIVQARCDGWTALGEGCRSVSPGAQARIFTKDFVLTGLVPSLGGPAKPPAARPPRAIARDNLQGTPFANQGGTSKTCITWLFEWYPPFLSPGPLAPSAIVAVGICEHRDGSMGPRETTGTPSR